MQQKDLNAKLFENPVGSRLYLIILGTVSIFFSVTFVFGETASWFPLDNYMVYMIIVGILAALFYCPLFNRFLIKNAF